MPQPLLGGLIDVGHITLLVSDPADGTSLASIGYYPQRYRTRSTLSVLAVRDEGVLVSPDPLYVRAISNPTLRPYIEELHRSELSEQQANLLNDWTCDDDGGNLALTKFTTSKGEDGERAVMRVGGESFYAGWAGFLPGAENCATWVNRTFAPGCIDCPAGLPRFCRAVEGAMKGAADGGKAGEIR